MKKTPLLHAELSYLVASLGHGDALVVADAGLPVPPGSRCIDLALTRGVPSFEQVVDALLTEMQVEHAVCASEMATHSPRLLEFLRARLGQVEIDSMPHAAFKARTGPVRAIIRTGECTPYANVILYAGVVF